MELQLPYNDYTTVSTIEGIEIHDFLLLALVGYTQYNKYSRVSIPASPSLVEEFIDYVGPRELSIFGRTVNNIPYFNSSLVGRKLSHFLLSYILQI